MARSDGPIVDRPEAWVVGYGRAIVRWRWGVVFAALAVCLALAAGAHRLVLDAEYKVWFSEENPELRAFESLQNVFARNDSFLFVVVPKGGEVFHPGVLAAVEDLTRAAWKLPYSRRVDSITNFQHTRADGDELVVEDLVRNGAQLTPAQINEIRDVAFFEPELARRLISDRGHVTGVNVILEFPGKAGDERPQAAAAARALRDDFQTAHPGIEIKLTGLAMLDVAFFEASQRDGTTLTPIMLGLIGVLLLLLLRSVAAALAVLAVVILSAAAAMGAAGWIGMAVTPPTATAPTIIMTLAVADSVHVLSTLFNEVRAGRARHAAVVESLRVNVQPVLLTSVTTAIGFLSLNFSDAPPFRDLGNVTAFGVMVALGLSLTFLPALMAVVPLRARRMSGGGAPAFGRFADFVILRRVSLTWSVGILVAVMAVLVTRIELDDDFIAYFDRSVPFRSDTDFMTANLTGLDLLEYAIAAEGAGGIAEPKYLQNLDRLAVWLRAQPEVVHVSVFTDTMRRINKSMHGDDPAFYRLPGERNLAAQYLLLYELSLPFGLSLNDRINVDKSAVRVTVTLDRLSQIQLLATTARIDGWIAASLPAHMKSVATGPSIMFAHISDRNIRSMLFGTGLALVLISGLLVFAFRSPALGAISLLPNLAPAIMAFGLWGLAVRQVDVAVSVIAAISLGIVVDDTVHFLSKYLRARRERGAEPEDAVRYAFTTVGPAMTVTTLVLVAGFLVLAFSPFAVNSRMGLLTAIAITCALVVDFLLLPPLLIMIERTRRPRAASA